MKEVRYIVISPVRDEQQYIAKTIESVARQSVRPTQWIIVNDGSSDETGRIIEEAAKGYTWLKALHNANRGVRRAGVGVMEAFYAGFNLIGDTSWEYLIKLDGDVTFEANYFEECFARFAAEPKLGIGGGLVCNNVNGELVPESKADPPFHVRGATKIYKFDCWRAIGGLPEATGWDTLDELKANMLGWTTRTFPEVKLTHHRRAGEAYGTWPNWVKNGRANYATGYHPLFMLVKCTKRFFQKPFIIAGLGLCAGYLGGYLKRAWQVNDQELIRYLRRQQMQRLLGRPSLWG